MINRYVPVIIPSYEPDERLICLLETLKRAEITNVIIINDGSDKKYDDIFEKVDKNYEFIVLKHYANLGKGRALKTAFNYCLNEYPDIIGCVTADSDGQHTVEDIKRQIHCLEKDKNDLILGSRNFDQEDVPFKSRMGNKITRKICRWLCGIDVKDTQTGLRAIPKNFMEHLLNVSGERFEFETNMLIETLGKCNIKEMEIKTVYDSKENHSSHFDPIKDSLRIYKIFGRYFMRFLLSSVSSFIIDIVAFYFICNFLNKKNVAWYVLGATIIARVISSLYNYIINYTIVFNCNKSHLKSFIKYYILVWVQMLISGFLVTIAFNLLKIVPEIIIKIVVDTLLFVINFWIQRDKIFN